MNEITIGKTDISVKEYNGQRVVTFKDIDTVHGRPDGTARKRFNDNKSHFVYGEDYFKVQPSENRTVGIKSNNGGIVLTESGYLMIVKSFTDSIAWEIQKTLVKSYFRAKEEAYEQLCLDVEKTYEYMDKFYKGKPVLTTADIQHFSGLHSTTVGHALKRIADDGIDFKVLKGVSLAAFKKENPSHPHLASSLLVIFKSGFDKLAEYFSFEAEPPQIMTAEKKPAAPAYSPTADEYITSLGVLRYIRTIADDPETADSINTAIKFCAMALSIKSSMN